MIATRAARAELARVWDEASGLARASAAFLGALLLVAVIAPRLGYVPGTDALAHRASLPPSTGHLLGTDHLGRDIAWRLTLASQAFAGPGLLAALVSTAVGVCAGATSGWLGGPTAAISRWLTGSLASLPRFVWVLLACAAWGDSPAQLGAIVGLAYAPTVSEAVHGRLEALRSTEVFEAARAHGVPGWRRLWIHGIVAGCGRTVARHGALCFGYFLVVETTLAYIGGFGVSEPWPSWGNMLAFEWGWSPGAVAPAVALWLAVAAVTQVADALQEDRHG